MNLLASIKDRNKADDVAGNVAAVKSRVAEVAELIEKLTNALKGDSAEVIGDLVESELASMDKAIEEAAKRIEVSMKCIVCYVSLKVSKNLVHSTNSVWKCCIVHMIIICHV